MITKLTLEQVAKFPKYVEEGLRIGLSTTTDRLKAEEAMDLIYECAGLEKPKLKIWVHSPLSALIAHQYLKYLFKNIENEKEQVRDQVGAQVGEQVRDQVWKQVREQVRDQVRDQVGAQVGEQVWAQVGEQVWDQVRDQVGAQVGEQVRDQVGEQIREQMNNFCFGSSDAAWISFYQFFKNECDLKKETEKLAGLMAYQNYGGWFLPYKGIVILSDKPKEIHMKNKHLHREDGPSVLYEDDFAVYSLNGLRVPKEIVETRPENLMPLFQKFENVEYKREILKKMGIQNFFKQSNSKKLDVWQDYELHELDFQDGKRRRYLKMVNPSTGELHLERVEDTVLTCKAALAWRNNLEEFMEPIQLT